MWKVPCQAQFLLFSLLFFVSTYDSCALVGQCPLLCNVRKKLDMLMFPIFYLCNLKCYTHNTHHPNYIYYTLLVGKLNRFNTYILIQTTQTNHIYDSIIQIIHLYELFESLYHIPVSVYLSSASVLLYIDTLLTDSSKPN